MKVKKILAIVIIATLFLGLSINVFATNATKETISDYFANQTNKTLPENIIDNTTKNEVTNTIEKAKEKLKEEEEEILKDIEEEIKESTAEELITIGSYDEEILDDLYDGNEEDFEQKSVKVEGNTFLVSGKEMTLKNCTYNGDVFIAGNKITIENCTINGSLFIAGKDITINAKAISGYIAGNEIKIGEKTEITRDLRLAAEKITIEGTVNRNLYAASDNIVIKNSAKIENAYIESETKDISKKAEITNLKYNKVEESDKDIGYKRPTIVNYWIGKGVEIAIILLITIVMLIGLPKFIEVNNQLRIRNFFLTFFTGILEIILSIVIVALIFMTGHGIGYGFALSGLVGILVGLGETLFIIALAVRISRNPDKVSGFKVIVMTAIVAAIIKAIGMLSLLGFVGWAIVAVLKVLVAISGFGATVKVIFTTRRKLNKITEKNKNAKEQKHQAKLAEKQAKKDAKIAEKEMKQAEKQAPVVEESVETGTEELHEEIKNEVAEEVKELKEEHAEEVKEEIKEEVPVEEPEVIETVEPVIEEPEIEEKQEEKDNKKKGKK